MWKWSANDNLPKPRYEMSGGEHGNITGRRDCRDDAWIFGIPREGSYIRTDNRGVNIDGP
jgi:hypothetical protein